MRLVALSSTTRIRIPRRLVAGVIAGSLDDTGADFHRNGEMKRAPFARLDSPAKSGLPSSRPGRSKSPGPAPVPPKRRVVERVGLLERLEHRGLFFRRNSDPGVAHRAVEEEGWGLACGEITIRTGILCELGEIWIRLKFEFCDVRSPSQQTLTTISPDSVNLIALPTRFTITCRSRCGSAMSRSGTFGLRRGRPVRAACYGRGTRAIAWRRRADRGD